MAVQIETLYQWLDTILDQNFRSKEDLIAIDDGGLNLVLVGDPNNYWCEVGGMPREEEEEERRGEEIQHDEAGNTYSD